MDERIEVTTTKERSNANLESWNTFFSRLAHAENAAATQCAAISDLLTKQGQAALAEKYQTFSGEEKNHFRLVSQICKPLLDSPESAQRIYNGELMNKTQNPLERMAIIHLVFEPAALAFLGFFHQCGHELITDHTWANEIKSSFREILQDEVGHVYSGSTYIKSLLNISSPSDIAITKRAMRRHRAFIIAGVKAMFKTNTDSKKFLNPMISRFNWYYAKATEGVFV